MQYGTFVLSISHSITTDVDPFLWRSFHDVCTLQVGIFVFQRPDTKSIIIDFGGKLVEDVPQNVYVYNEANHLYFLELIRKRFQSRFDELSAWREKLLASVNDEAIAILKLNQQTDLLVLKNQVDFNANREKEIRGLDKNKRRHEKIMQRYTNDAERHAKSIRELGEDCDKSLELARTNVKLPRMKRDEALNASYPIQLET